ncbi:717_t:CDS:1, partial [Paraglomus occultum]
IPSLTTSNFNNSSTDTNSKTNPPQTEPSRQPRKRQLRSSKKNLKLHPQN